VKLHLAKGLDLPASAVTQTFAFMGKRGAGKTYAAGKLVEELVGAGAQVVVIDPVGNWYGLRISASGKGPGLSIPVLGGDHGDLPLVPQGGALVADLAVETNASLVLDVSPFSKGERQRFVTAFTEQLFRRKKQARTPIHVVLEEARLFVPQRVRPGEEPMLGAMEDLIRLGRNYGIGVSLLDQRPQSVNKEALNQTECLLAFQLIGSQERKAIAEWAEDKGIGKEGVKRLSELERGQAIVWSPTWLKVFDVYTIARKATFDASSTPEVGAAAAPARPLAKVDLERLRGAMEAVAVHAKADDPKALRKRIAELERQLAAATAAPPAAPPVDLSRVEAEFRSATAAAEDAVAALTAAGKALACAMIPRGPTNGSHKVPIPVAAPVPRVAARAPAGAGGERLGKGPATFLRALASLHPKPMSTVEASILAGYSPRSSTVRNILSALRTVGYVEGGGERIVITDAGRAAAGPVDQPRSTEDLLALWTPQLGKGPSEVLRLLVEAHPNELSRIEIEAATGYSATSSTMRNILSKLRSTGLLVGRGDAVRASDALFPGARP